MSPAFLSLWLWIPAGWVLLFLFVWGKPSHRFTALDFITVALVLASLTLARYLP